jgi:iron complex transport system substrate-binding protein
MRAFACALALSLALAAPARAAPPQRVAQRVASLNLCTDELLLMLAEPAQIVSVTHLAHKREETPLWQRARRYGRNDGSLVSVAGLKPDLVLTMGGGARDRVRIAERLGIRTLDLPFPQSLRGIKAAIGTVAAALGRGVAGQRLIAHIELLERTAPPHPLDTIWLGGGGRTVPAQGLAADWMRLAGLRQGAVQGVRVSLEQLLVRPPQLLLRSDYRSGQYSSEQRWLSHPLAARAKRSRTLATDGRPWTCMGPALIEEVVRLRKAVRR